MSKIGNTALALGLAGAMMTAVPSFAAPVLSNTAALKQAQTSNIEQVQWRGRGGHWRGGHWGGGRALAGAGIGFAAGALVGSAIASSNYGYYGGGPYGYYDAPAAYGYYDEGPTVYAAPAPVYRSAPGGRCWITTGGDGRYGYWGAC
jgi:hypothetical protein